MAGLTYKIGADVTDFSRAIDQATADLSQLDRATKQTAGSVTSSINNTGRALASLPRNAQGAAAALNSVGQVARDLPFGFIAIQNNLPIVIDQFGALVRSSGGVGGALKGIVGALAGPAGLAFAFGASIAGITALIQKYGSLSNAIQALTPGLGEIYQRQKELNDIQKAGTEAAGEEIAKLTQLSKLAGDAAAPLELRQRAIAALRKEYGGYLQNVSDEVLLNNQAAAAINQATQALLNKALAIAAEKKLSEVSAKLLDNQLQQVEAVNQFATASELSRKANEKSLREGVKGIAAVNTETVAYNTQLEVSKKRLQDLGEENRKLEEQFKRISDIGNNFAKKAGINFLAPIKTPKATTPKASTARGAVALPVALDLATITTYDVAQADKTINELFQRERGISVPVTISPQVPPGVTEAFAAFAEQQTLANLAQNALDTATAFNNFLAPAIDTVFGALANGASINDALKQSFRALVVQMGIAIAKAALLAGILSIINPVGAGAAGLGKGFGAIFKNLFSQFSGLPKFAEGGIVTRPTLGIFGEAGAEAVIPLDKLNAMLSNFGGGSNIIVGGALTLRGNDLVAAMARTQQQQGRAF